MEKFDNSIFVSTFCVDLVVCCILLHSRISNSMAREAHGYEAWPKL
jgi:hypothetical protein